MLFSKIDRSLIPNKLFYFFFYGGVCCISPFMPHFLKQRGFSPIDITAILGTVPFVVVITKPSIAYAADRTGRYKWVLAITLLVGVSTVSSILLYPSLPTGDVEFIRSCNDALQHIGTICLHLPVTSTVTNSGSDGMKEYEGCYVRCSNNTNVSAQFQGNNFTLSYKRCYTNRDTVIKSVCSARGYCDLWCNTPVAPLAVTHFHHCEYWFYFFAIVGGNAFGMSPSYTIVDALTMFQLQDHREDYGKQRMWMSLGMGVSMLTVGILMDSTTDDPSMVNYLPSFVCFIVFMFCCITTSLFLPEIDNRVQRTPGAAIKVRLQPTSLAVGTLCDVMKQVKVLVFGIVSVVVGMNFGNAVWLSVWYLKNIGAMQTTIGVVAIVTAITSAGWFFLSGSVIKATGHEWTAVLVLIAYSIRSLLWSFIEDPWITLAIEVFFGFALGIWVANMASFAAVVAPRGAEASAQAFFSALYDGFGVGLGSLISGTIVQYYGGMVTWRIFSGATGAFAVLYACFILSYNAFGHSLDESQRTTKISLRSTRSKDPSIVKSIPEMEALNCRNGEIDNGKESV